MVYVKKSARGLPPLKRTKIGKKAQERHDKVQKKLYEANRWWNDRKFQLHWVYPKSNPKRVKRFYVSSKKVHISKNDRKAHFVGHSRLK